MAEDSRHFVRNILLWLIAGVVIVLLAACVISVFGIVLTIRQAERERESIYRLCEMGGTYTMCSAVDSNSFFRSVPLSFLNQVYKIDLSADAQAGRAFKSGKYKVNDAGLVHLKALKKLRVLDFEDTAVTDGAVVHLRSLESLRTLNLRGTKVTDRGVEEIRRALPDCEVIR